MVSPADLTRRLRELITALDRRTPRAENPAEVAIAQDAALLRKQAASRLAEIAAKMGAVPENAPDRSSEPRTTTRTPFPAMPTDVAVLTVQEFTFDLEEPDGPRVLSMERICRTFMDDANRALVARATTSGLSRQACSAPKRIHHTT